MNSAPQSKDRENGAEFQKKDMHKVQVTVGRTWLLLAVPLCLGGDFFRPGRVRIQFSKNTNREKRIEE